MVERMETTGGGVVGDYERADRDRVERGWSKDRLAEIAGVSDMTIVRFLRGRPVKPSTLRRIADALGHSIRRYLP